MLHNNADARRCSYFELGLPVIDLEDPQSNEQQDTVQEDAEEHIPQEGDSFFPLPQGQQHEQWLFQRYFLMIWTLRSFLTDGFKHLTEYVVISPIEPLHSDLHHTHDFHIGS